MAIGIGFEKANREGGEDPQVDLVSTMWGKIIYRICNMSDSKCEILHKETYVEALEILRNEEKIKA